MTTQEQHQSTTRLLLGIWSYISRRRRLQMLMLLVVMLASGAAELVSLGAVLPFLAVLSNPEELWRQPLVHELAGYVGYVEASQLVLPATIIFAIAAVSASMVRLANLWLNGRLVAAVGSDLSCEAYRRTLFQPYGVHLQRNSSAVITSTTTQINLTINALNGLLQLTTASIVASGIFIGLLLIDASVAVGAAALFGATYLSLAFTARRELQTNSKKIAVASGLQLKALQEGLGAIRDVLLDGTQNSYLEIYQKADSPLRRHQAKNNFLGGFPRFALEALGMVAISILGGLLVLHRGSGTVVIPLLGALALGAQRLLPALQQIYAGWTVLNGSHTAMEDVLAMLNQPITLEVLNTEPLILRESIRLSAVCFRYSQSKPDVLKSIDLEIYRGERVGIIGSTGSGKSTTVDLLMGLLPPSSGRLLVDGDDLYDPAHPERLASWRAAIAHVPQSIYLIDSTIAENIAFGVPRSLIDFDRVRRAASQAQIDSFIKDSLGGYESIVGERGMRLSGGQRQRIGIARALYKRGQVLVLDEATSALDTATEQSLMEAVNQLSNELTIVMIAHRLSTVKQCDRVVRLEKGRVVADGLPERVLLG